MKEEKRQQAQTAENLARWKTEREEKQTRSSWIAILCFIIICVAFFIFVAPAITKQQQPCQDNTTGQTCSDSKPYFCAAGQLVYSPERCGCPDGDAIESGVCQKIRYCADGTIYGRCSSTNLFCANGSLIENASACGCPEGYAAQSGVCQKLQYCTDGTVYGSCSSNKPYFCVNGSLVENASVCGCPYGPSIKQQGDSCIDLNQPGIPSFEKSIHDLINQQREQNGLADLALDDKLSDIARNHSEDMANRDYFAHDTPEGVDPTGRAAAVGYVCQKNFGSYITEGIGENIFQTYTYDTTWYTNGVETSRDYLTPNDLEKQIVDGWMNSPGHRENILTATYDREGIGVYVTSNGAIFVTEDFC